MQGTLILGDIAVTFAVVAIDSPDCLREVGSLTVKDCLTGEQEQRTVSREAIFAALAVSLLGDEYELPAEILELAESAQSEDPALRFIP